MSGSRERWSARSLALVCATLLVAGANGLLFHSGRDGYSARFVSYNDLYHLEESPRVRQVELDGSTLTLHVSGVRTRGWISDREQAVLDTGSDGAPRVALEPGLHAYRIVAVDAPWHAIEFSALHGPGGAPTIGRTNLPFGGEARFAIDDFAVGTTAYPPGERERARAILAASGIDSAAGEVERIERLASHLLRQLASHRGAPSPRAKFADGLRQYEMALAGETKLHCANFSEIYAAFANLAGIPTRVVDVRGALGDVSLGAHTFTESYLERSGAWVYVDLQLEVLHVGAPGGRFLNGAQLLELTDGRRREGLEASVWRDGEISVVPYEEVHGLVGSFVHGSASLTYHRADARRFSLASRLLRYTLRPEPAYALGASNATLWARVVGQLALLGIAFAWLARFARRSGPGSGTRSRPGRAER